MAAADPNFGAGERTATGIGSSVVTAVGWLSGGGGGGMRSSALLMFTLTMSSRNSRPGKAEATGSLNDKVGKFEHDS